MTHDVLLCVLVPGDAFKDFEEAFPEIDGALYTQIHMEKNAMANWQSALRIGKDVGAAMFRGLNKPGPKNA